MINHNANTCKEKKQQITVATTKAAQPSQKPHNIFSYACHMCGLNGHKMINCPNFTKMQKTFHGKFVIVAKVQSVVKAQIAIANVNVVDVMLPQLKNMCSRIESQGKQNMLLIKRKKST